MKKGYHLLTLSLLSLSLLAGCGTSTQNINNKTNSEEATLNLYTSRHHETDTVLYDKFKEETGIKINVVEVDEEEMLERLAKEGAETKADLIITTDAGRFYKAKEKGLLQPVKSEIVEENIKESLRDKENYWIGLTKRARVLVYDKERTDPEVLSTYEALADPKWKGKILTRSSSHMYNQSLVASMIMLKGEEATKEWVKGLVANFAQTPNGSDKEQAKAIVDGKGDVAIINTYYVGRLLNASDSKEIKMGEKLGVFFPNQETTGTHMNISAVGITKASEHVEDATKFIEFLTSEETQGQFAENNYEYPANSDVEPSELLKSWGTFKEQDIDLSLLGKYQAKALEIMTDYGWQ